MNENLILDAPDSPQNDASEKNPPQKNAALFNALEKWVGYAEYLPLLMIALGFLFKYEAMPYGGELLVVGMMSYACMLFVLPFALFQGRSVWQIVLSYFIVIGFTPLLVGFLLRIQSWPYSQELMTVAMIVLLIVLLIVVIYFLANYKDKQVRNFILHILVRSLPLVFFGLTVGIPLIICYKLIVQPLLFKESVQN